MKTFRKQMETFSSVGKEALAERDFFFFPKKIVLEKEMATHSSILAWGIP